MSDTAYRHKALFAVRPPVAHLGEDLSHMLLQLGPNKPDVTPRLSLPQMRARNHQQQPLFAQQPQPEQRRTPALCQPGGADVASKSQHGAHVHGTQMQLSGKFPAAPNPAFKQSSRDSKLPCQVTSGAVSTLSQKTVFAKHMRPGPQLTAKRPPRSKAALPGAKVGNTACHTASSGPRGVKEYQDLQTYIFEGCLKQCCCATVVQELPKQSEVQHSTQGSQAHEMVITYALHAESQGHCSGRGSHLSSSMRSCCVSGHACGQRCPGGRARQAQGCPARPAKGVQPGRCSD